MTDQSSHPNPLNVTWLHGTKSKKFATWICPPPPPGPADVPHSAIFFTSDRSFAEGAGTNIAAVQLHAYAKIITPVQGGTQSSKLRKALLSNPLAAQCKWLVDDNAWIGAWSTGEIMRFAYDKQNLKAVVVVEGMVHRLAAQLQNMLKGQISNEDIHRHAQLCLTRAWIEQIVKVARENGFQVVHGLEVDRGEHQQGPAVAMPWLAVMDQSVISAPNWI
ncbi:hypothetical protein [Comamonas sp.]|uniref:hypothetical protein n=1 Tax=Comamonas sp. TaxID=34028 RepID=UPI0025B91CFC|nr:hypothetical protein [Comamonas sp.]